MGNDKYRYTEQALPARILQRLEDEICEVLVSPWAQFWKRDFFYYNDSESSPRIGLKKLSRNVQKEVFSIRLPNFGAKSKPRYNALKIIKNLWK